MLSSHISSICYRSLHFETWEAPIVIRRTGHVKAHVILPLHAGGRMEQPASFQPVFVNLPVEGGTPDTEHFSGLLFLAITLGENPMDIGFLNLLH